MVRKRLVVTGESFGQLDPWLHEGRDDLVLIRVVAVHVLVVASPPPLHGGHLPRLERPVAEVADKLGHLLHFCPDRVVSQDPSFEMHRNLVQSFLVGSVGRGRLVLRVLCDGLGRGSRGCRCRSAGVGHAENLEAAPPNSGRSDPPELQLCAAKFSTVFFSTEAKNNGQSGPWSGASSTGEARSLSP
jgi:hypothetical protein